VFFTFHQKTGDRIFSIIVLKPKYERGLKESVQILGARLQECRELSSRQRMGMEKFKSMAGPNWKESRYIYVISGLQASL
jgi:hypothetical protein